MELDVKQYVINNYLDYDEINDQYILFDLDGNIITKLDDLNEVYAFIENNTSYWETEFID